MFASRTDEAKYRCTLSITLSQLVCETLKKAAASIHTNAVTYSHIGEGEKDKITVSVKLVYNRVPKDSFIPPVKTDFHLNR